MVSMNQLWKEWTSREWSEFAEKRKCNCAELVQMIGVGRMLGSARWAAALLEKVLFGE